VIGHASTSYWDRYFRAKKEAGADLDWGGLWTEPFLPWLHEPPVVDAVMSNVAAHMFSYATTRALFAEAAHVLRPGGLLLLT
jgi:hypothetical protein